MFSSLRKVREANKGYWVTSHYSTHHIGEFDNEMKVATASVMIGFPLVLDFPPAM